MWKAINYKTNKKKLVWDYSSYILHWNDDILHWENNLNNPIKLMSVNLSILNEHTPIPSFCSSFTQ